MTDATPQPYFCDLAARPAREIVPGIHIKTFWQEKMLIGKVALEPNASLPTHSHPHEQCGAVISGEFTLTIGAETRTLGPGELYTIPGDVEHSGHAGAQGATIIDVFAPVRAAYQFA